MADAVLVSKENGVSKYRGSGEIAEAFGKKFSPAKTYEFEFETYENKAAAVAANKWPSDADAYVLAKVNKQNEASAKSAAYQKELKSEREEYENSPEFKFKQLVASLVAVGKSQAEAEAIAKSLTPGA